MNLLKTTDKNFQSKLQKILHRSASSNREVETKVATIISLVQKKGDAALFQLSKKFDQHELNKNTIEVSNSEIRQAFKLVQAEEHRALDLAASRIRDFHERHSLKSWQYKKDGLLLGQRVSPLDRVGIYVPGGKATYPSSVLMNAIPAQVAGVKEIVMVSPFPSGQMNPYVLVAANIAGVDRIFKIGGAQAIAALAYGTASIPRVDKIVGPGNTYVATAKRQVFGQVAIDMIAGPSEITIISDGGCNPYWIAADLLSQAEHDEQASALLLSWKEKYILEVQTAIEAILKNLPRATIAKKSLQSHGAFIRVRNEKEAATIANDIAPEHLELSVKNPESLLKKIKHAGAIFLGYHSTESFGDYLAGPNHVLPTNGTARFSSPLSTFDFLKFSSLIDCSAEMAKSLGPSVVRLAEMEGLHAHALAMKFRL
ncbi:MAG: histidinol dehydrogenase [Deltaproteobacteria bacterium]|nr:histidinol dehydrogenase [Deltaproteobacteria bacterium]